MNEPATESLPETPDVVRVLLENRQKFLAFAMSRLGDRHLAEEVLQDAFVKGITKYGDLRSDEAAVAWFYRVLRNAMTDRLRALSRERGRRDDDFEIAAVPMEHDDELERVVCGCVSDLLETLKPEYSDILKAVELDGMAVKDYAEQHDLTASNAGVRVHRARKALLERVQRACGACAHHGCLDCACGEGKH